MLPKIKGIERKTFSPAEIRAAGLTKEQIKKFGIKVDPNKKTSDKTNIKLLRECCGGGPGSIV
jgi:ribosomal protein L13E